jgi:hypothetical protein
MSIVHHASILDTLALTGRECQGSFTIDKRRKVVKAPGDETAISDQQKRDTTNVITACRSRTFFRKLTADC